MSNQTTNTLVACADCKGLNVEELELTWFPGLFIKLMSLATLSFLTTAANLFMIYIACKTKSIVSNTKVFFISLAIAHLLGSLIVIPVWIITRLFAEIAIESRTFCQGAAYVWILMILVSFYSLSALSLDRFLIISNPMRYPVKATTTRKLMAIAGTWLFCILFAAAPFAGWGEYKFQADAIPICGLNMKYSLSFTIVLIVFGFGLPLCVDIFCCGNIISIARRQSLSIEERKSSSGSNSSIASSVTASSTSNTNQPKMSKLKQKLNALRLVFAGTGSFLVCWLPYLGAHIWMITQRKLGHDAMSMPYILEFVVMCVALINGFVNPVVIMVSNRDFRRRIKLVLFRRFGMFNLDISDDRSDADSSHGNSRKLRSQEVTSQESYHNEQHQWNDSEVLSTNNLAVSQKDISTPPTTPTTDCPSTDLPKDVCVKNKLPETIIVHIHECKRLMSQISIRGVETTVFLDSVNEVKRSKSEHDIRKCFDMQGFVIK